MNNLEPLTPADYKTIASTFLISIFLFLTIFYSSWAYFDSQEDQKYNVLAQEYAKMNERKKADFNSRVTSQFHAVLSISLGINGVFFTCVDPSLGDGYSNFFTSDYCRQYHSSIYQMMTCAFTIGYLTFDTWVCYALIQEKSKLQNQTYIHHFVGITGAMMSIVYGAGGPLVLFILGLPILKVVVGLYIIFIFFAIYILNLIWFNGILQVLLKSLKGNQKQRENETKKQQ
ncbi:UNKNOWN [Stylonychia lemnae]|uniref:TLC domain-containing protein n=1 Tax=Stylonychia lemnae TaxID=5949 RepID=A0A078AED3_STYLE|nr:UNKNOWN [Stylonychia lemnae]|eukprot:CDW80196.1 UNKNOWN [Stylonychia lemnae]